MGVKLPLLISIITLVIVLLVSSPEIFLGFMHTGRRHLFHIVDPSPWPIVSAFSAFFFLSGLAFYMHRIMFGGVFFLLGLLSVALSMFFWCNDIVKEASFEGHHTLVVRSGLRYGFLLFIISEVMLFAGFFWAFFHSSFCPSILLGAQWPPLV